MKKLKAGMSPQMVCRNHFIHMDKCKHYHYIYYEDLYDMVLKQIRGVAKGIESGEILRRIQSKTVKQNKRDKLEAEKAKIHNRIAVLNKITKKLYEDYACDLLDIENYHRMLNEYQQEQKQLSQRSVVIQNELDQKDEFTENLHKLSEEIQKYLNVDKLTANMLNQLVERIEVGYIETVNGVKQQEITIVYRFIGTTL